MSVKVFLRDKSRDLLMMGLLAMWFLVFHLPVTLGQTVFSAEDAYWLHLPARTELARALSEGRLPLWTPYLQAGLPLLAEGQVGALYPINLFFHRLLPVPPALSYTILFALLWSSLGMYLLVRSCGMSPPTAWLAGFAFGVNGVMTARVTHADVLAVAAWLPWLFLFQQKYWHAKFERRRTMVWFLLACFAIGLQFLGGSPQRSLHNVSAFAIFGMVAPLLWRRQEMASFKSLVRDWLKDLPRTFLTTTLMIIGGAGLAAIQLLPTFELLGFSTRGQEMGLPFVTSFSLQPAALTQFIAPFLVLGEPTGFNLEYWGYLGVLPLVLAGLAPFLRRDFRTVFFALFGLGALSLALGNANPMYGLLDYVPIFNRFRVPARFLFLFAFAATFLMATAFEVLQSRLNDRMENKQLVQTLGMLFATATLGVIGVGYTLPIESWMTLWKVLPIALWLVGIGLIFAARFRLVPRSTWVTLALGLTALDLTMFAAPFLSNLDRSVPPMELTQVPRTVQVMDSAPSNDRVYTGRFPTVTQAAARATLWTSLSILYAQEGVTAGYNPLSLSVERNETFIRSMSPAMVNLMNVRYYLLSLEPAPPSDSSPLDETEPSGGLTLDLLSQQPAIPPMRVAAVDVTSYTDHTTDLADGSPAGEIVLGVPDGQSQVFPMRLGNETAEWSFDALSKLGTLNHSKPVSALNFPAFLSSLGRDFDGHKYVARFVLGTNPIVTSVGAKSFLPGADLTIEKIDLIDQAGRGISLATLLHRNEMALAFKSHNAALWENHSYLPRAFMVHAAEIVDDAHALARVQAQEFAPNQMIVLSDAPPSAELVSDLPAGSHDQVDITQRDSQRVDVRVNAASDGYLLLTDSWYPGWEATLDGASAPIYRADYIFRAVRVPLGEHRIIFEYHPLSFILGAWISGISLVLLSGWAVCMRKRNVAD
ncbi:MAG: YfhO family protein [Chloroflexota bacterium]|nr:YfhO family protein [Chloroflexota bacterium]